MRRAVQSYAKFSRKHRRKTPLLFMLALIIATIFADHFWPNKQPHLTWAEQIVLGTEYGGQGKVISLWTKEYPTVSVIEADKDDLQPVLQASLQEINGALSGTVIKGLKQVKAKDEFADILIYYTDGIHFDRIAKENGFTYYPGNWGFFWMFWNDSNHIHKAYILLDSSKLHGEILEHFTREELTQSLGLSNDSPLDKKSIFYSKPSVTTHLSPMDASLLNFAYTHLKPGMTETEVIPLLKAHFKAPQQEANEMVLDTADDTDT